MSRLREQRGMSLVEVMMAALISVLILSATLAVIDAMWSNDRRARLINDQQQSVRVSLDRMARQLRNLASPTVLTTPDGTLPRSVERNLPNDLIFKDVDGTQPSSANSAKVRRVRYCLDTTGAANQKLWMQTQNWDTLLDLAMPEDTKCPGAGWDAGKTKAVAENLTNALSTPPRPVFTYSGDAGVIAATDPDSLADIDRIGAHLFLRFGVKNPPAETELVTSVFLRNQNREPKAQFTVTVINQTTIQLNGSASKDPEGRPLEYVWSVNGLEQPTKGILVQVTGLAAGQTHIIKLKAFDPAGLKGESEMQVQL